MKALEKALKENRVLVFIDLEGTQFSHEMIEIGAYVAILKDDLTIKRVLKGFSTYVKAKHSIGGIVTKLTGITEKTLEQKGKPFPEVLKKFRGYVGKYWNKCKFVTFGSHDLRIINMSVENSPKDQELSEIAHAINKNHFDMSVFLGQYVQDQNGNPLSLSNYLKVFDVPFEGVAHTALADAYNLMILYKALLEKHEVLEAEYKKTLTHVHHMPTPVQIVINKLIKGETVTPEDYDEAIKEALR